DNNIDNRSYKQQITNLWNEKYKPIGNKETDESSPKLNALSAHIFKKRKI
ncbi:4046_t:CDS:1, partial [Diversispora eburnea]